MAVAWPSIADPDSFEETVYKPQYLSQSDSGAYSSRPKGTAMINAYKMGWSSMSSADKATLKTFIGANMGGEITYTHFDTAEVLTLIFIEDKFTFQFDTRSKTWSVNVTLAEAL